LNAYVKIDTIDNEKVDFEFIKTYSIVLATGFPSYTGLFSLRVSE